MKGVTLIEKDNAENTSLNFCQFDNSIHCLLLDRDMIVILNK